MAILKAFDLDLSSTQDKNERWTFRNEIRCVASLYARYFERFKTEECQQILVDCVDEITDERLRNFTGIYEVQVVFDIEKFWRATNYQKKQLTLNALTKGIDRIVTEKNWDRTLFDRARDKVIECDYVNHWVWGKPKKSPAKQYTAKVFCEHDVEQFKISIIIQLKGGEEINRVQVLTEYPNEFAFVRHLGELKWLSPTEVALFNKNGTKHWGVSVSELEKGAEE